MAGGPILARFVRKGGYSTFQNPWDFRYRVIKLHTDAPDALFGNSLRLHLPLHDLAQSAVDASLISSTIFFEPSQNVGI
jgi:hypothetical protein